VAGSDVPIYWAGQLLGAMIGATLVWVAYYGQFQAHLTDPEEIVGEPTAKSVEAEEKGAGPVLGIFSTGPEVRNVVQNLATEIIGTVVLVLAILTQGLNDGGQRPRHPGRPDHRVRGRLHRSVARRPHRLRHQPGP
jgi:glycerol uptake facilitator protein